MAGSRFTLSNYTQALDTRREAEIPTGMTIMISRYRRGDRPVAPTILAALSKLCAE